MIHLSETQRTEVEASLFGGRRIEAIRRVREATGAGLKDAKQFVDQYEATLRDQAPDRFVTNEHGRIGTMVLLLGPLVGGAIVIILAILLLKT